MPLLLIILFSISMLSITITKYSIELDSQKETIKQQMLSESANEFSQFANASAQYIQSIDLPFPGTNLGVYDLQKVGLLPSTFPLTTPFGQTLIASYVADPNNSYALDVSIHTTGAISQSLAQQAGYNSQGGLSTIQYNIANQALSKIPTNLPGSNGQVFGLQNGEVITSLGSNKTQTVPSGIATSKTEVAEYILAPGQFGYWLINGSAYASETLWQVVGTNGNTANSYWFGEQYGGVGIGSQAFSLTCPSGPDIDNLGNLTTNNQNILGMSEDGSSDKNNTYSMVFCVPAYKEQVQVNLNNAIYTQILNGAGSTVVNGSSGYWNGSSYIFNGGQQGVVNTNYTFVTNNMNGIVNNNLYVNGYAVTGDYAPAPHWPSNEATPYPLINYISSTGFDLVLKNPQGTNSVYQIEMNVGDLFTGSGNTQSLINPQTGIAQNYQVWNQPANGSLNDNSQENSWDGYDVTYNPSTPSGVNTSIYYYDNGTKDTLSFIVPTPVIN